MIKVKIVMDEEKFHAEKKYDYDSLWNTIDGIFAEKGLVREAKGLYRGVGANSDFGALGACCVILGQQDWFLHYVKEWLWLNSDRNRNKEDYEISDLLMDTKYYKVGFRD